MARKKASVFRVIVITHRAFSSNPGALTMLAITMTEKTRSPEKTARIIV
jgi:hypothetical protein